jgi:hypothetical protein
MKAKCMLLHSRRPPTGGSRGLVLVSSLCIIEIEIAISQSTAKPTSSIIESFSDRKRSTAWPFHGGRISEIKIATAKSRFKY